MGNVLDGQYNVLTSAMGSGQVMGPLTYSLPTKVRTHSVCDQTERRFVRDRTHVPVHWLPGCQQVPLLAYSNPWRREATLK